MSGTSPSTSLSIPSRSEEGPLVLRLGGLAPFGTREYLFAYDMYAEWRIDPVADSSKAEGLARLRAMLRAPREPSPGFTLFVDDWLGSKTIDALGLDGEGMYVRLLALSWKHIGLPVRRSDVELLAGIEIPGDLWEDFKILFPSVSTRPSWCNADEWSALGGKRRMNPKLEKTRSLSRRGRFGGARKAKPEADAEANSQANQEAEPEGFPRDRNKNRDRNKKGLSGKAARMTRALNVELPSSVGGDGFRSVWASWIDHVFSRTNPTPTAITAQATKLDGLCAAQGAFLIREGIGSNAQGFPHWAVEKAREHGVSDGPGGRTASVPVVRTDAQGGVYPRDVLRRARVEVPEGEDPPVYVTDIEAKKRGL